MHVHGALIECLQVHVLCIYYVHVLAQNEAIPKEKLDLLPKLIEPWFLFALIWSIGATCDGPSRAKFSTYLREKCEAEGVTMPFPVDGLVYDYKLDDGGVSVVKKGDDDEEDDKKSKKKVSYNLSQL